MRRISTASRELRAVEMFDYVVFNENGRIEQTLDTVDAILCAENHRVHQASIAL
jgi:guanylate kinase